MEGVPSMGLPQPPSVRRVRSNFSCTPASEMRTRSPTPNGALRRLATSSANVSSSSGSAVAVVGTGGGR
ncbi:MAG: hypothetical protein M1483_02725 [Actinobacteria bacterium]|nr:hypothetical protein [Actinomycetota bacterium]MCL6104539.1 hypothetical protein [Actinomycetota bacterium]